MLGMVKASQNPMAAINQMAQSDQRLQQVMQVIQQGGGDPKTVFYNTAKQMGVDPNSILKQVQNL